MRATDELRRMLDERGVHWWTGEDERKTLWESSGLTWEYFNNENGDAWLGFLSACEQDIAPEQAIAATLGGGCDGGVHFTRNGTVTVIENAADGFIVWLMGETYFKQGKRAEFCEHYDTIEQAIAATMGEPPYDELLRCLANDWNISASWDGLRKFWNIELTEDGARKRDAAWAERTCRDVSENPLRFECSACGGLSLDIAPRYCPACGAEVKLHHGERRAD